MSWEIVVQDISLPYECYDEMFEVGPIIVDSQKTVTEPNNQDHKVNDVIEHATYRAESKHGVFIWNITARQFGFESTVEIMSIDLRASPNGSIINDPSFSIKYS